MAPLGLGASLVGVKSYVRSLPPSKMPGCVTFEQICLLVATGAGGGMLSIATGGIARGGGEGGAGGATGIVVPQPTPIVTSSQRMLFSIRHPRVQNAVMAKATVGVSDHGGWAVLVS